MSHFKVTVLLRGTENIAERVKESLAPFQENNMGDCPRQYLKFFDETETIIKEYETGSGYVEPKVAHKQAYATIEEFAEAWHGREKTADGKFGYWENPNKKWDWWTIGGRWARDLIGERTRGSNGPHGGTPDTGGNVGLLGDAREDYTSFAWLTPEGEWIERGEMGWWATVVDEKDESAWKESCKQIIEKYRDCTAVVVDCHI